MVYQAVFIVHVSGGIMTLLCAGFAFAEMWRGHPEWYRTCARVLGALAAFEILSGAFLSVLSLEISAAALCGGIAVYLALVFAVEYLLYVKTRRAVLVFPTGSALAPIAASLAVFSFVLSAGY